MASVQPIVLDRSRQEASYGPNSSSILASKRVLLCGASGLGIEIAKNLILSGIGHLFLLDPAAIELLELSGQPLLSRSTSHIGRNRVSENVPLLKQLDPNCNITELKHAGPITSAVLHGYDVVICTCKTWSELVALNLLCRENGQVFICSELHGLFGYIFTDCGPSFTFTISRGKDPIEMLVVSIRLVEPSALSGFIGELPKELWELELNSPLSDISTGDKISISRPPSGPNEPTVEYGDIPSEPVDVIAWGGKIYIAAIAGLASYKGNAYVKRVPCTETIACKTLAEKFNSFPWTVRSAVTYRSLIMSQALDKFRQIYNHPLDRSEAKKLVELARSVEVKASNLRIDNEYAEIAASTCMGHLAPMIAMFGGLLSEEVIKVCLHKYHPLDHQFFSFDGLLTRLIESGYYSGTNASEFVVGDHDPYAGQVVVFGGAFQQLLSNMNLLLVGAGALGCELLKNFALMGVCTSGDGICHIADADTVALSNLHRQYLFRAEHIDKHKCTSAYEQVLKINPDFKGKTYQTWVNESSSTPSKTFNDRFWDSLDCIISALDSIKGRIFLDEQAHFYKKPMLEAGTEGIDASGKFIWPYVTAGLTQTVGGLPSIGLQERVDAGPVCPTAKGILLEPHHTATKSMEIFGEIFHRRLPYRNPDNSEANTDTWKETAYFAPLLKDMSLEVKVDSAKLIFAKLFKTEIEQVCERYPGGIDVQANAVVFMGKPLPTPLTYDDSNPLHKQFINSVVALLNRSFDAGKVLPGAEFEKDDATHVDFVFAASQVYSHVYHITPIDRKTVRILAGKIVAGMITVTAAIGGWDSLNLYMFALGKMKGNPKPSWFFDAQLSCAVSYYNLNLKSKDYVPDRLDGKLSAVAHIDNLSQLGIDIDACTALEFIGAINKQFSLTDESAIVEIARYINAQNAVPIAENEKLMEQLRSTHNTALPLSFKVVAYSQTGDSVLVKIPTQ